MKQIIATMLVFSSVYSMAQTTELTLNREDIKAFLTTVKQRMVYDTVDNADNLAAVKSMERILSRDKQRGKVDVPNIILREWIERQGYQVEEFYRVEDQYKQVMRTVYELYLADPKLEVLKVNDKGYPNDNLKRLRKMILRDIRQEERNGNNDWMKKKYRKNVNELDDEGN